jgi:nitrite reductase/ring-hydroxylating ferredoxin subunit
MPLDSPVTAADPSHGADPSADPEPHQARFDWRRHWYPVAFIRDLPRERPHAFSLYDEPLVLFFGGDGRLGCLRDQCGHRAARLYDGCIRDGRPECLYHGWQYDADGACRHIQQLPAGRSIPPKAAVARFPVVAAQGIAWVWPGDPTAADEVLLPLVDELDADGVTRVDFQNGPALRPELFHRERNRSATSNRAGEPSDSPTARARSAATGLKSMPSTSAPWCTAAAWLSQPLPQPTSSICLPGCNSGLSGG